MFQKILVPTDGSDAALAAHTLAIGIARKYGSTIIFMHALETVKLMSIVSPFEVCANCQFATDAATKMGYQLLDNAVAEASAAGVLLATPLFTEGRAVPSILEAAHKRDIDLIVLGSHGRGGISGALLGTVAEGVLRHADVPVLLAHARPRTNNEPDLLRGFRHASTPAPPF